MKNKYLLNRLIVVILVFYFVSCANNDDDNGGSNAIDCVQALENVNTARTAFETEVNEITCTVFKNALANYLDNCNANPNLQFELDNLPNCSQTGQN